MWLPTIDPVYGLACRRPSNARCLAFIGRQSVFDRHRGKDKKSTHSAGALHRLTAMRIIVNACALHEDGTGSLVTAPTTLSNCRRWAEPDKERWYGRDARTMCRTCVTRCRIDAKSRPTPQSLNGFAPW